MRKREWKKVVLRIFFEFLFTVNSICGPATFYHLPHLTFFTVAAVFGYAIE